MPATLFGFSLFPGRFGPNWVAGFAEMGGPLSPYYPAALRRNTHTDQQKELVSLRQIYDPYIIEEVEFLLQAVTELDELFLETPKYDPIPIILWVFGDED